MQMKTLYDHIPEIEKQIGYTFENKDLLTQAFTRKTWAYENGGQHNETLEFIGDTVLGYYTVRELIKSFGEWTRDRQDFDPEEDEEDFCLKDDMTEADLTRLKQHLVQRKMLAQRIDTLGLAQYLRMGQGDIKKHAEELDSVKEDLFESILGAVALDSDWNTDRLSETTGHMLDITANLTEEEESSVELLQQWNQKRFGTIPDYRFTKTPDNRYKAEITLWTGTRYVCENAVARTKNSARAQTAAKACRSLEEHNELNEQNELKTLAEQFATEEITQDNAINKLQELCQKKLCSKPEYHTPEKAESVNGKLLWTCTCRVEKTSISTIRRETDSTSCSETENTPPVEKTGYGTKKTDAKKDAARKTLKAILSQRHEE